MELADFSLHVVVDQIFGENTYIAHSASSSQCVIFDPGLEPGKILELLAAEKLTPAAILVTHGHSDHIGGITALREQWPECPIVVGMGDAEKLTDPEKNLSAAFGLPITSPPADVLLRETDRYEVEGFQFEVLETPGHSAGHIVYLTRGASPWVVFGGDVLFQGGIGRTDFADGSFQQLKASIHEKLFVLPDETVILPGHGPATTVGHERATNPFVGALAENGV